MNRFIPLMAMLLAAVPTAGVQDAGRVRAEISGRAIQPGEVVKLDVICGCKADRTRATVLGHDIPLFPVGDGAWRGLIGIDLDTTPGTYPVAVVVEETGYAPIATTRDLVVAARQFPERQLTVEPRFVNPPKAAIERIRNEARRLEATFEGVTTPRQWDGSFQAPAAAPARDNFGARSVFNGQPRSPHAGVDFPDKAGTPVTAPGSGVVAIAEPLYFTGNTVVIDHGLGLYTLLAHLSKFAVKAGDRVERGQIVGFIGATGRATGPHLHWTVRLNGARVDPLSLIAVTQAPEQDRELQKPRVREPTPSHNPPRGG